MPNENVIPDAAEARRARLSALMEAVQRSGGGPVGHSFGRVLAIAFYALLVITILWPRYFYLQLPGLPGLSLFVIYSTLFCALLVPYALSVGQGFSPMVQIVRRSPVLFGLFLTFFVWRLLTSVAAPPIAGETPWFVFTRIFIPIGVYFFISTTFFMDRQISRTALRLLMILTLIVAVGGLIEVTSNLRLMKVTGLDRYAAGGIVADSFMNNFYRDGSLRAQSVFTQPLVFGQFMGALAPLCAALFFNETARWRIVAASAFFSSLYCVYISTARSGLLVLIVASATYAILTFINRFRYRWVLLGGAALLLAIATLSAFQLGDFLAEVIGHSTENLDSARYRQVMISLTFDRAAESPLVGYGDGTAKWLAGITMDHSGTLATIDSQYLSVLLHNGYPGLILWVGFLIAMLLMAVRNALEGATPYIRAVNSAIAAYVAGMMVGFSVLSIEDNMVMVYLFAGIVVADRLSTRSGPGRLANAIF